LASARYAKRVFPRFRRTVASPRTSVGVCSTASKSASIPWASSAVNAAGISSASRIRSSIYVSSHIVNITRLLNVFDILSMFTKSEHPNKMNESELFGFWAVAHFLLRGHCPRRNRHEAPDARSRRNRGPGRRELLPCPVRPHLFGDREPRDPAVR